MYEPKSQRLLRVRRRISPSNWAKRVADAEEAEKNAQQVNALVESGSTLNAALAKVGAGISRSTLLSQVLRYRKGGLENLIDARTPRAPTLTKERKARIEALRRANPTMDATTVHATLAETESEALPSLRSINREFRRIDDRRRYAMARERREKPQGLLEVEHLPLAGAELLLAAELETGMMGAITGEIMAIGREAKAAAGDQIPVRDTARRDEHGHFTARYNAARKRKPGEEIAGYLRSAATKGKGRVPTWARFVHEKTHTIAPKVETLTLSWGVAATKGWDALRAPSAAGLGSLTGYAYMPSTLKKLTTALAIAGAGDRLLEALAVRWHAVAAQRWEERGAIAALYVDNHVKEVWSSLFTMSGKVSHLSRVMPCITSTYVHTGAGTPVVVSVQSGSAPLAPRLLTIVESTEKLLEEEIRRAVVIDAEGSTFDVLQSFVSRNEDPTKSRIIVTPLRPSRAPELEIRHGPGSYYRPYREHDQLRIGTATLTHKSTGRTLEIGTLEVKREHREQDTILLTKGLVLGESGKDLANLYFARWPLQENFFKEGGPLGLAEHHTNCAEMVLNVAVESKLERMGRQRREAETKLAELEATREACEANAKKTNERFEEAMKERATRRKKFDSIVAQGVRDGKKFAQAAVGHQAALAVSEAAEIARRKAQEKWKGMKAKLELMREKIERIEKEEARLRPLTKIRQLDVAAEKVLTASKLALSLLITFVLREYMPLVPMSSQTFIPRVMHLPGRREIAGKQEAVIIYENPRDPEVNRAIAAACAALNERRLQRGGRSLSYRVEAAPDPGRPAGERST
jgi:hypothetical protein